MRIKTELYPWILDFFFFKDDAAEYSKIHSKSRLSEMAAH